MGSAMAGRLLGAGHEVAVFNRTASRAEPLVRAGARLASSPREACEGAEAVFAMTADDVSSRAMWLGEQGALAARVAPEAFAIECSTLSHAWVTTLSRAARERGMRYIDAPLTLALADSLGIGTPFADAARAAFRRLVDLGGGDEHEARVIDVARDTAAR